MGDYALSGKVALVTGAARGIGLETARLLHARGASVALVDLRTEEVEEAAGPFGERGLGLTADASDRGALDEAVAAVVERFGGLDVCVANAGVGPPPATIRMADEEAFERVIEIDLLGVWRTVRAALPQVVERQGHIVVIASVYAFLNGGLAAPYAMSKAGVEQLGRALRAELAQHGASASVAYFGFIDTEMVRAALRDDLMNRAASTLMPSWALRRLPPSAAAEAIVSGIERRAPRIIAPRWWAVYSVLRGILNPVFDRYVERNVELAALFAEADDPSRATKGIPAGDRVS